MQLHEVDEIKELFIVGEVNEALQTGWRIVAVVPSAEYGTGEVAPVPCYIMGRRIRPDAPKITAADLAKAGANSRRLVRQG
ncbi:hypothetical protein [Pseudomonas congelans]|uniref:hypothetical protein n=1 Tax=Pseudomonas congelans TaxID=200452 RepID=UPI001BDCEAC5|nr:hypothetical protein [Pseudomonas congelans]QVX08392.1 hypothetical protein DBV21_24395 [Pseudomonas congelans]